MHMHIGFFKFFMVWYDVVLIFGIHLAQALKCNKDK